jgi:hypothetical protein
MDLIIVLRHGDHSHIAMECPSCVQSSGYVRKSIPGRFAEYAKCETCGGSGVIELQVPLAIPDVDARVPAAIPTDRPLTERSDS